MADLKTTNIFGDAYINNKVGIATNAPATRLQIGQLSPTAATEGIQFGDDTNTRIYRGASGQINFNGTINVLGNTYLGDANGDTVFVNDTIRIGATDSGDASLFFGEGAVAGSDYGARWYWDSGYTFTWYTRNAGTDTALFDYVTNDTNYINWRRHFHMQNKEINYNAQVHFNAGTRFVGNNTEYLIFRSDSNSVGGIQIQSGNTNLKGYVGYWDSGGGGILNNTGNWAVRYNFGNANSGGTLYGDWSAANLSATGYTMTNLTGAYQNTTVYDSPRTQSATPSRGIRAPASSIQFTDSYAIAPFYTYRSTGDWPVPYGIGWGTGGESSGIFQRYASNGYSFGDMIFYTGNDGSGAFSFRRHTWEGTTYFAAGSGELSTELFRVDWAGKATAISFGLTGGFVIDATGAYGQFNNWVHLPGYHGFYSSNNGAHIYPNNGSYGSWRISGTRGGWYGLEFDSGVSLMANSNEVGFHRNGHGWQMWWSAGTGYIHKGNPGGGTQATILDSSNYTSYTPGLGTNNTLTGINVINNTSNTLINNQSGNLGLTMFQATAGTDAYMTFHVGGDFAAYFGLGGAENDLVYGGWSVGNVRYRILHSGNQSFAWNLNQNLRTTDSPTFNTVTANITGNAYNNLSNDYKDIYVYGDVNTYYVVLIQGDYLYSFGRYSVTRGYNWAGPDTWNTATHRGGLTLDWEWSGDTAWGGNDKAIRIIEFNESYSTMVAGLGYPVNGGVIIWLRGGGVNGALYRIRTPVGSNATVTAYDGVSATNHSTSTSFTAADSTVFSTRANTNNVSAEILARYPVRGAAILYNENNAVLHAGNYNSYSPTLTGTGASGTWSINVTGNAATATTLQTARNINGTSFNGSAAITTATWGTARTLTIGSTGKSVDGSGNVSWTLAEIGAAATNQTMFIGTTSVAINRSSASQTLTGISIDGNAATVTNGVYTTGDQSIGGTKTFTRINFGATGATPYSSAAGEGFGNGITFGGDENSPNYRIYTGMQNWNSTGNYSKLTLSWHTGIRIGAYKNYGGTIFYNNAYGSTSGASANEIFSVGKGDDHIRVENYLIVGSYLNVGASNSENPTIGQIWTQNTSDNYLRKSTPAHFRSQITDGYYPSLTGANASGTWSINITGNAATATNATNATNLSTNRTNWSTNGTITAVVGQLSWKHYGNNHTIIDASNSTSPAGGAINNTNPDVAWTGTYPTLMGWNGSNTYGVRVDSARYSDLATTATVNSGNTSAAWYPIVWHSSNTLYSTAGVTLYAGGSYIQTAYFNSSDDVSTGNISHIVAKFGDNYHRSATAAKVAAFISGQTMNIVGSATSLNTGNTYQVASLGVSVAASNRLHVNGDGTNPAIRVDNTGVVLAATVGSNGRTFYGWLPVSVDGTTRWIRIFS